MIITKKIDRNKLFAVIFVLFCTFAYLSTQRGLWDTGKQSDDNQATLTAYLPMFGYHQFDNDVLCDAASHELMPGHRIIYLISSYFLDIMVVPKLIQIFLFYMLVYFGFKIGSYCLGNAGGVFSVIMLLTSEWLLARVAGGFPRSFGPALYAALLYCILKKNERGVLLVACASTLFYPMAIVVSLLCFGIIMIKEVISKGIPEYILTKKKILIWFGSSLIFILLVTVQHKHSIDAKFGGTYSIDETKAQSQFQKGGRIGSIVPLPNWTRTLGSIINVTEGRKAYKGPRGDRSEEWISELSQRWEDKKHSKIKRYLRIMIMKMENCNFINKWNYERGNPIGFGLYIILPLFLFLIGWFRVPEGVVIYVVGSFASCLVAALFAFTFYHPDRYMIYPISVLVPLLFSIGIGSALKNRAKKSDSTLYTKAILILIFIFLVKMFYAGPAIRFNNALNVGVAEEMKGVYKFVMENVPEDKAIAGELRDMDAFPIFAKRRVLVNYESSIVWLKDFNEKIILPRTRAVCEAYFASSDTSLKRLRREFGVDYLLVRKETIESEVYPDRYMFAPFNDIGRELFRENKGNFFFLNMPKDVIAYEDSKFYLVNLAALNASNVPNASSAESVDDMRLW